MVYLQFVSHTVLRIDEFGLRITECVHPFPTAPAFQGIVDITYLLFCRHLPLGETITYESQFSCLRQIAIDLHQRVQFVGLPRIPLVRLCCRDTGCCAVTVFLIIMIQGFPFIQFLTHDNEHIMVEYLTVRPLNHEGLVGVILHLGELVAEFFCQFWLLEDHLPAGSDIVPG